MKGDNAPEMIWRPRPSSRAGASLVGVLFVALGFDLIAGGISGGPGGGAFGVVCVVGAPLAVWRLSWHPSIRLSSTRLIIVNAVRIFSIPLTCVRSAEAGYYGINVTYHRDGKDGRVTASAVQKANWSAWVGKQARADAVVRAIDDAIRATPPGA